MKQRKTIFKAKRFHNPIFRKKHCGILKRSTSILLSLIMVFTILPFSLLMHPVEVQAATAKYIPMTVSSGFNADVIYDSGETIGNTDAVDHAAKVGSGSYCFYSTNYSSSGGLPTSRVITDRSGSYSGLTWTLASYTGKNALRLSPGGSGTLKFDTVGAYQEVYFLVTAGGIPGGSASITTTVNYSDGTSSPSNFTVVDWYSSSSYATAEFKRRNSNGIDSGSSTTAGPYFTRCKMNLDTSKLVYSITIKNTASSGIINMYAVTGKTAAIDAPTNLKLTGCTALNATWDAVAGAATYRIDISTNSTFTAIVGDYNNKVCTTNSCQVKGLELGKTYYARVRAVNSSGGQGPSSSTVNVVSSYKWEYKSTSDSFMAYCTTDGCDYDHTAPMTFKLEAEDVLYNRNIQTPAVLTKINATNLTAYTGYTASSTITYYSVDTKGATTGGTEVSPRDVGYYYAKTTVSNGGTTYTLVAPFEIYLDKANYNHESLGNLEAEVNNEPVKKVIGDYTTSPTDDSLDSPDSSAGLLVHLNDSNDVVTLYKIADMKWNIINNDYDDLVWDSKVTAWNETHGFAGSNYTSPNAMTNISPEKWTDYFNALLKNDGNITSLADEANKLTPYNGYTTVAYTPEASSEDEYITKFDSLPFGTYAIIASGSNGKNYNVTVVNVVPYHNGPLNSWFANYYYDAYLKDTEVSIDKVINNKKHETVAIGDTVDFDINFVLPTYKDRVIVPGSTDQPGYTFYYEDTMSPHFTMKADSMVVYGLTNTGEEINLSEIVAGSPATDITYNEFRSTGTGTTVDAGNVGTLSYDDSPSDSLIGSVCVPQTGKLYEVAAPTTKVNAESHLIDNVYRINFNLGAIKEYNKTHPTAKIEAVRITYQATVASDFEICSENNYNTAYIYYEKNSTGTLIGSKDDTVHAYTYALNLIKIDGDTVGTAKEEYLTGAIFWIYKETDTFVKKYDADNSDTPYSWAGAMAIQDYPEYSDYEVVEDDETATNANITAAHQAATDKYFEDILDVLNTGKEEDAEDLVTKAMLSSLDDYKTIYPEGSTYYYYEYTYDEDEPMTLDNGVVISKNDKVTRVFKRMFLPNGDEQIESNGTAAGVIVAGLNTGNYILQEVDHPTGYNGLAEDILFSIRKMPEQEANENYAGSLRYFKNMDDSNNFTGIHELKVLNYKGLTLPSTGGIGTLIFTLLGMSVMLLVLVLMIIKRRRSKTIY